MVIGDAQAVETVRRLGYEVADVDPDVVLINITSIDTALALRDRFRCAIIFLITDADAPMVERSKVAMPCGYLLKPFDDHELERALAQAMGRPDD